MWRSASPFPSSRIAEEPLPGVAVRAALMLGWDDVHWFVQDAEGAWKVPRAAGLPRALCPCSLISAGAAAADHRGGAREATDTLPKKIQSLPR